jgi:predicted DNA-binding transcriptional regulator YafY
VRTIYRDVRDLSVSGVPVQGEAGVGYRIDRSYELTPLMFTPDEVEAVVVGIRMVEAFGGPALRVAAQSALNKVILALPNQRRGDVETAKLFAPMMNPHRAVDSRVETIRQAIALRHKLRVEYEDEKQTRSERVIRPLGLYFWGASWTLAAWCELRVGFRHFRLDRMAVCEESGEEFAAEADKSLEEFLRMVDRSKRNAS